MLLAADHALRDLRYAVRRLRRAPAFAVISTLLIALSLAGNVVIFGLVDVLFLRSLPVRDPESLVQLFQVRPDLLTQEYFSSDLRDLIDEESTTLTDVMGEVEVTTSLEREAGAARVDVGVVTANYFAGLGMEASLGRVLGAGDDAPGNRLAVLSHEAFGRLFGEDASVVGRTVRLGGLPYQIVGVLPKGFNGTSIDSGPDLRVLFANRPDFGQRPGFLDPSVTKILARVRAGASLGSAAAQTRALWSRYREEYVAAGGVVTPFDRDLSVELRSISNGTSRVREQFEETLLLLFGGAGLVLAMVCLNVGGLLFARAVRSRKDTAVRAALGATPARIAREWTVESVLLAAIGGIAGLVLAAAALPALVDWLSPRIGFAGFGRPPTLDVAVDLRIAAFGLIAMLATGVLASLVPTFSLVMKASYETLKAASDDRKSQRIQFGLCVVQIALGTVLLLGGGLLVRTLDNLNAVDAGFDRERLVRFEFDPGLADYEGPAAAAFQRRLLEETATLPGIERVAVTTAPLMQGIGAVMVVSRPGVPVAEGSWNTNVNPVSSAYFDAMGIEVLRGTVFDDRPIDAEETMPVVVNEAFVRRLFDGEDNVVGQVFDSGAEFAGPAYRIVGVVSDASYRSLRESDPPIFYFSPLSRQTLNASGFSLIVRTAAPEAVIDPVREIARSIDPAMPVVEAITMSDEIDRSLWRERLATALTGGFAGVGLAVAAIGLYVILAYYVATRRREIGLRAALGAGRIDVLRLISRRMTAALLLGLLIGACSHIALGRWLTSLLYDVSLFEPPVVGSAVAALLLVSLLAGAVPVLRAFSVDPANTLRQE